MNLCFLDISKGFDKVNISVLLLKLMSRGVPHALINVLHYWYSISMNCVRWENVLSAWFNLGAGIRQGGVLSPTLFSLYVDEMLKKCNKRGCLIHGISVCALMYADDIVFMSPSVSDLQYLLDLCCHELSLLDLQINPSKSVAIRVGPRFMNKCIKLSILNVGIPWASEAKYLGIYILSATKFKCSFEKTKAKFYRAANSILAKVGNNDNKPITLKLIFSIALPVLTYALEALSLSKLDLLVLEHPWTRMFEKIFKTFDKEVVKQCQMRTGYLTVLNYYILKSISFFKKMSLSTNVVISTIAKCSGFDDVHKIADKLNCRVEDITNNNYLNLIYTYSDSLN